MVEDNNNNGNNAINLVPEANRTLRDYVVPLLQGLHQSIRKPSINANNFEIKPAYIQMIQSSVQFGGLPSDDPNSHLVNFLKICDTFKYNGVTDDAIRLRLFPFFLRDKAKSWLNSLPNGSITTWEDLAQKFLAKFFSPAKTTKMGTISPHSHNLMIFYNGLVGSIKTTIDAAAGGALMSKNATDTYNLLEEMASNNYQWPSERLGPRKTVRAYEIDALGALTAKVVTKVVALSKKFDTLGVHAIKNSFVVCEMCGDSHSSDQCSCNSASVQFVGNFNRQQNNPYSNSYNPG
ncbi:Retrotransposon gag domain - like 6 [Theobroma cacao]|nr:Retrotransposon gag domain - like 6 [Theobroma cacao]